MNAAPTLERLLADHDAAIIARLREHDYLAPVVHLSEVPRQPDGQPLNSYVIVYPSGRPFVAERRDLRRVQVARTYRVHAVSIDPAEVVRLQGAVVAQLLDFRPTIPARKAWRLGYEASSDMRPDESVSPWLYYVIDQFDLNTTPARGGTHG